MYNFLNSYFRINDCITTGRCSHQLSQIKWKCSVHFSVQRLHFHLAVQGLCLCVWWLMLFFHGRWIYGIRAGQLYRWLPTWDTWRWWRSWFKPMQTSTLRMMKEILHYIMLLMGKSCTAMKIKNRTSELTVSGCRQVGRPRRLKTRGAFYVNIEQVLTNNLHVWLW